MMRRLVPEHPLARVRLLMLVVASVTALLTSTEVHGYGHVATAVLLASWLHARRRRSFSPALDVVCWAALVVHGHYSGYAGTLGLAFNAIWLRSLYGSPARMLVTFAACIAGVLLSADRGDVAGPTISMLLTLAVGQMLAATLVRHQRALSRERALRAATERLLDDADVEAVCLQAARAIVSRATDVRLLKVTDPGATLPEPHVLVAPFPGDVTGTLVVGKDRPAEAGEQEALTALAGQIALALGRRRAADELAHRASHDALTGLANRALLSRRLEEAEAPAVIFIDLDDFKTVNDRLGHAAGDALLVAVGRRIAGAVREDDTVARLGGDEFAIVVADRRDADTVAERIAERLAEPFSLFGHEVRQSASIGVADESPDAERLLRHADIAMYAAKARGKAQTARFTAGLSPVPGGPS